MRIARGNQICLGVTLQPWTQLRAGILSLVLTVLQVLGVFADDGGWLPFHDNISINYSKKLRLEVKQWQTTGSGLFRISFPSPLPIYDVQTGLPVNPSEVPFGSTLNYKDIDAGMLVFSGEVRPFHWIGFDFRYGSSDFDGGRGFDHDWFHAPDRDLYSPSGHVYRRPKYHDFSESESSLDGSTRLLASSLYLRIFATSMIDYESLIDLAVGYIRYGDKIRMRNGIQTEAPDSFFNFVFGIPPPGPFPGLDSSYSFDWRGPTFGLRQTHIFGSKFSVEGTLNYSPYMRFNGEGRWNLRSDFKQNPSFSQNAHGYIFDYDASLAYTPVKMLSLRAGYMFLKFKATNGTDTTFFSNGTTARVLLEEASSKRSGFTTSISLSF